MNTHGGMEVRIGGPTDPLADRGLPYQVEVRCQHAHTRTVWSRRCPRGCHRPGQALKGCTLDGAHPERRDRCQRAFPSDGLLIEAAVAGHERSKRCGCDAGFWMLHGAFHQEVEPPQIQGVERTVDAQTLELLPTAHRYELGGVKGGNGHDR